MEQKGSMLLKVISIIMMVGGIIGAVASVILAVIAGAANSVTNELSSALSEATNATVGKNMALLWFAVVLCVIGSVFEIVAGVIGKNNWNNPPKAQTLIIFGAICCVISLVSNILMIFASSFNVFSLLAGFVLPVLYIVGAVQLKNQA